MKIILKQDIENLGSLGDEVVVKAGYARNYLIPENLGLPITKQNIKQLQHHRELLAKNRALAIGGAKELAEKLDDMEVIFTMKAGENGKLFGSITSKDILNALEANDIDLGKKQMSLSGPIKSLGSHNIIFKLHTEVSATLSVKIVAEKEDEVEEVAEEHEHVEEEHYEEDGE
ncbi:MAG: large subunit ribosomal protein L9 [bacterium]|jgi:large subunit ribosomal protein L9